MADLSNLRELTKSLSVLYVEDSPLLLKKMTLFLNKIFKTVYEANNGQVGLESFIKNKPDIIITDLNMPVMNGHDMIKKIKHIDPDMSIIVYSAYTDTQNLLESIHLGVVDFIPKPVDINLFQEVVTKVVNNLKEKKDSQNVISNEHHSGVDVDLRKKLLMMQKSKKPIEFINHYKGVPIFDKGYINKVNSDTITVETPYLQREVVKYENKTVLQSEFLNSSVEATLDKVFAHDNKLVLRDLRVVSFVSERRKQISVEPDDTLQVILYDGSEKIVTTVKLVSIDFVSLQYQCQKEFQESDEIKLEFQIQAFDSHKFPYIEKIEVLAEVYTLDRHNSSTMFLFELGGAKKDILQEYIESRRKYLISELKNMKD